MSQLLKVEGISKEFPGVKALDGVNFELDRGEVLALVGENGAGKSTLMKILSGIYSPDAGRIIMEGDEVDVHDPKAAQKLGISIIHQEMNLMPHLTVAQNIFIGREPRTGPWVREASSTGGPSSSSTTWASTSCRPRTSGTSRSRPSRWWRSPRRCPSTTPRS